MLSRSHHRGLHMQVLKQLQPLLFGIFRHENVSVYRVFLQVFQSPPIHTRTRPFVEVLNAVQNPCNFKHGVFCPYLCLVRPLRLHLSKILSMAWDSLSVPLDGVLRFIPQRETRLVSEFVDDIREAIAVDVVCP